MPITLQVVPSRDSRTELLAWLNDLLQDTPSSVYPPQHVMKVEQCGNGVPYILLLPSLLPTEYPPLTTKAKVPAKHDFESVANLKLIVEALQKNGIPRPDVLTFEMDKLIKGAFQANLQFLQWFRGLYDVLPQRRVAEHNHGDNSSLAFSFKSSGLKSAERVSSLRDGSADMQTVLEIAQAEGTRATAKALGPLARGGTTTTTTAAAAAAAAIASPQIKNGSFLAATSPSSASPANTDPASTRAASRPPINHALVEGKVPFHGSSEDKRSPWRSPSVNKHDATSLRNDPSGVNHLSASTEKASLLSQALEGSNNKRNQSAARRGQDRSPLVPRNGSGVGGPRTDSMMVKVEKTLPRSGSVSRLREDGCGSNKETESPSVTPAMGMRFGDGSRTGTAPPLNKQRKAAPGVALLHSTSVVSAPESGDVLRSEETGGDRTGAYESTTLEMVKKERQFYYDKLRSIEILMLPIAEGGDEQRDVAELSRSVLKILYATS